MPRSSVSTATAAGPDGEPTIVERILAGQVDLVVNTPFGGAGQPGPRRDGYEIRTAAVRRGLPCVTTMAGLAAIVQGIEAIMRNEVGVRSLQQHAERIRRDWPGGQRMTLSEPESESGPLQVRGTVLTVRRVDAYHAMTIVAPGIAARFKPGQFVTVAVGGPDTSMVLRRAFSIHDVRPDHGGTVEFIFAVTGPRDPRGWPSAGPGTCSTSPARSAGRSRFRAIRSAACWSAAATAARRCSRSPTGSGSAAARLTSCSARPAVTGSSAR